jgi:thiol-disulfide isomerase/thioredoxin
MVVREPDPEGFQVLAGTQLGERLAPGLAIESSSLPGVRALPATRASIDRWFVRSRTRLHPGDTLLLYVTDHGSQNPRDPLDNKIVLWGRHESLSVRQLRTLLDRLPPRVRVVALMSQCFSGGFARLVRPIPTGNVCGYFSSTADRPAYGCYAEVAGRERVGHSFEFMEALARSGRFPVAHAEVLASDKTPDVPLRTSDVFLADLLAKVARAEGMPTDRLIDTLLKQAWKSRARWEPELRLADRIGHAYGLTSPRSLAEIEAVRPRLEELRGQLEAQRKDWGGLQQEAGANLQRRFFAAHREWAAKVAPAALARLSDKDRARLATSLSTALRAELAASADDERARRPDTLAVRATAAEDAAYRMEVRLAVLLRLRAVLTDVAARVHLAAHGSPAQLAAYEALRRCEDLSLPGLGDRDGDAGTVASPAPDEPAAARTAGDQDGGAARVAKTPRDGAAADDDAPAVVAFPSLDDEQRAFTEALPGWMGIVFQALPPHRREKLGFNDGAAVVTSVMTGSPAQQAGVAVGDIVLGPPGRPFREEREIRTWTMLLPVGRPQLLVVDRNGRRVQLTLVPGVRPVQLPSLGPPRPATLAPPVIGSNYRGPAPPAAGGPFLLFFWATWCGPCKESLPEVLAFSRQQKVPVVAVTDEGREDLDAFFARFRSPFPETVVSDENRVSFSAYSVSGTPTFVLIDGAHRVQSYSVGYQRGHGLGVAGWRWDGR